MIRFRSGEQRGRTEAGWLSARHSFSFNRYRDPEHTHFGPLLVLNHDRVAPGAGFPPHPHDNMEIITIPLRGSIEHRDSSGGHGIIRPGEVQYMRAGTGVVHSEFNHSDTEPLELLQIWFLPEERGLQPGYEQRDFSSADRYNVLLPVASRDLPDTLHIHQDATTFLSRVDAEARLLHPLGERRGAYLYLINGRLQVNGESLASGDAVMLSGEAAVEIDAAASSEFVLFDVTLDGTWGWG